MAQEKIYISLPVTAAEKAALESLSEVTGRSTGQQAKVFCNMGGLTQLMKEQPKKKGGSK